MNRIGFALTLAALLALLLPAPPAAASPTWPCGDCCELRCFLLLGCVCMPARMDVVGYCSCGQDAFGCYVEGPFCLVTTVY
ncbi:MAG TPA: hypothetical protein PK413_20025 [Thermoanaerobaculia bacterium]|nr:hypothetical protein [Thermoanaerobaculia bacterium]